MYKIVYDNIIFFLQKSGGISVYWRALIEHLLRNQNLDIKFIEYSKTNNIFRKDLNLSKDKLVIRKKFPILKLWRYVNLKSDSLNLTIFHSSYYRTMKGKNVINVITVHDFTYEKKMKSIISKIHILQKKNALKKADGIICISENTKKDLLEIYPQFHCKKIKVIYNGFNKEDYFPHQNSKMANSIIFVGERVSYKNFKHVVQILKALQDINLIIVGPVLSSDEIAYLDKNLPNRYTLFNDIKNSELNILYNKSICLMYLSEYEGFGIPVLEAMSAGCPVIALNKSSIPEVAGKAGLLFEKLDYSSIINAVDQLKYNKQFRDEQIKLGLKNTERFSWDNCYFNVLDFYNELFELKKRGI